MTDQTMFDTVVAHLLTQNKRSMDYEGTCRYRSDDGTKCAIGCLISDDMYEEGLEGNGVRELLASDFKFSSYLQQFDLKLLIALQLTHDCRSPLEWYTELEKVAIRFDLNFNPPKLQSETA